MSLSYTISEILSIICRNLKRSRDHILGGLKSLAEAIQEILGD